MSLGEHLDNDLNEVLDIFEALDTVPGMEDMGDKHLRAILTLAICVRSFEKNVDHELTEGVNHHLSYIHSTLQELSSNIAESS